MRSTYLLLAGLAGLLLSGDAAAGGIDDLLEDAQEKRDAGRVAEAAGLYAKAVVAAQKKGDLGAEISAGRGLNSLVDRSANLLAGGRGATVTTGTSSVRTTAQERELLAAALGELDAKRHGAIVSASAIARRLLFAATEHGDTEHCDAAEKALRTAAKSKGAGRAAGVLLQYAQGLTARGGESAATAAQRFEAAYVVAAEQGWRDLAAHIGTERAGLRFDAGDVDGAAKILDAIGSLLGDEVDLRTAQSWQRAVAARLPEAPETIKQIVNRATKNPLPQRPAPVVSDGGYGRAKSTDIGRALKKGSKGKTLVTVRRTNDGLDVKSHFDPKTERLVLPGTDDERIELGGLVLIVRDNRISVFDVEVEHVAAKGIRRIAEGMTRGGIGDLVRAEYLLGHDETWTLTKGNGVSIESK